jgi:hypothetical protein
VREWPAVLRQVAGAVAVVRSFGVFVLFARDEVTSVRESPDGAALLVQLRVAARVVEMQVRVDDDRYLFGRAARHLAQRFD